MRLPRAAICCLHIPADGEGGSSLICDLDWTSLVSAVLALPALENFVLYMRCGFPHLPMVDRYLKGLAATEGGEVPHFVCRGELFRQFIHIVRTPPLMPGGFRTDGFPREKTRRRRGRLGRSAILAATAGNEDEDEDNSSPSLNEGSHGKSADGDFAKFIVSG